jgi:nitrogen fixation protein FixH
MRLFRLDDQNPLTGWHMLAIVLAFFGVIIAVNITLAIAATGTFPGLVVENSYVASQHYDELLASSREQDSQDWRYNLASEGGVLKVDLSRGSDAPERGLSVIAHVGRPSTTREDRILDFVPASDGSYVSSTALPPGLWEIDVKAGRGSDVVFRHTQEIMIQPTEPTP